MDCKPLKSVIYAALLAVICAFSSAFAQVTIIVVNNVGYEKSGTKRAVVQSSAAITATAFDLVNASGTAVMSAPLKASETVDSWSGDGFRYFKVADFSSFATEGVGYRVRAGSVTSQPFSIGEKVLQANTGAEQVGFFKAMRNKDEGDRNLPIFGSSQKHNIYGGWWDATGDPGKHISHLSYANYFNPQQIPLVVWALLHANELQPAPFGAAAREEAAWGADYLLRALSPDGYFYMSVFDNWGDGYSYVDSVQHGGGSRGAREICAWGNLAGIADGNSDGIRSGNYQCAMREGGGVSIAALARAYKAGISGDSGAAQYLAGAERAYAHLSLPANRTRYQDDGKENIIDDYCGLLAAAELYNATQNPQYSADAAARAASLLSRQHTDGWFYSGTDNGGQNIRPFYHASDEGLPVVALSRYYDVGGPTDRNAVREAIGKNLRWYHKITYYGANPFDYAKMYRGASASGGVAGADLARGRPATASREEGAYTAGKAFDGSSDNSSRWSSYQDGAQNDSQWISVELDNVYKVNKVILNWEAASGKHYRIDVSANGTGWSKAFEITNNEGAGRREHTFAAVDAKYVRMFGITRNLEHGGFSLFDFEVYGEEAAQPPPSAYQSSFFIPKVNETGYWWQGENARLASLASAFIIGAPYANHAGSGPNSELWYDTLFAMATAQLDWILGKNPFNACLMYGYGENNYPDYPATQHLDNIKGGICNGITSDRATEKSVEWIPYKGTSEEDAMWQNWRWIEQWLPHNAWYTVAVSSLSHRIEHGMPEVIAVRYSAASQKSRLKISMKKGRTVRVDLPSGADNHTEIVVYNIQGRTIFKHKVQPNARIVTMNLPQNMAKGAYILSIRGAAGKNKGIGRIYLK